MSYIRKVFILFVCLVFLLGMYITLSTSNITENLDNAKTQANNESQVTNCPDMLVQKGAVLALYNTKQPIIEGTNPIQFGSLDDYIRYLEVQNKKGINCPVLYLQQENNAQGDDVYRMRPSPFDLQGGLPASNTIVSQPIVTVSDANRLNAPYNKDNYPGFDPQGQYIGVYTNLDQIHDSTEQGLVSDDPMAKNWAGIQYTNNAVASGKYKDRQVAKPLLYQPKVAFYPSLVANGKGPVDIL